MIRSSSIDNGDRVAVRCLNYTGVAGVRYFEDGGEFAAPRARPSAMPESDGEVAGRPVRILSVRKSEVTLNMIVVRFAWADAGADA